MSENISHIERNQRMAAASSRRPRVDANGKPLTKREFTYDAHGKLVSVSEEQPVTEPTPLRQYDSHGNQVDTNPNGNSAA